MPEKSYDHNQIELKWFERWQDATFYRAEENSTPPELDEIDVGRIARPQEKPDFITQLTRATHQRCRGRLVICLIVRTRVRVKADTTASKVFVRSVRLEPDVNVVRSVRL